MNASATTTTLHATLIDDDAEITLVQMSRVCRVDEDQLQRWVREGVLHPLGASDGALRFRAASLKRARVAVRLSRDLELEAQGLALALDLLEEIDALRARLARAGL